MLTKHTPAPWHRNIAPARKYNTVFAGRNTHVCYLATQGLTNEEIEANCNLIAAAPELLDVAIAAEAMLTSQKFRPDGIGAENKLLAAARAVIIKATGEAS